RHTRFSRDWSSDVCSSDLLVIGFPIVLATAFVQHGLPGSRGWPAASAEQETGQGGETGAGGAAQSWGADTAGAATAQGAAGAPEIGRASGRERGELWEGAV